MFVLIHGIPLVETRLPPASLSICTQLRGFPRISDKANQNFEGGATKKTKGLRISNAGVLDSLSMPGYSGALETPFFEQKQAYVEGVLITTRVPILVP